MANTKTLGWIVGIGLVAWYFLRNSVRIDVGNPGVSSVRLRGGGIEIEVGIPILNRSDFQYDIKGFLGHIMYGNTVLGSVTMPTPVPIPKQSQANPKFLAKIQWSALTGPVYDMLNNAGVVSWLGSKVGLPIPGANAETGVSVGWNKFSIRGTLYVSGLKVDINQALA